MRAERYLRQIPLLGKEGQEKLERSTVLVAGVGGLGSPVAYYLASSGVGRLILVDDGRVELSNLNRQILYGVDDVGKPKVHAASKRLRELNPDIDIVPRNERISSKSVGDLLEDVDVVVDCLDNFTARYTLADAAWNMGVPFVHGAVEGMYGQITTLIPGKTPSLREIFPSVGDKKEIPIIGPAAGVVGAIEALEVIKLIAGIGEPLAGRLMVVDLTDYSFETISI